MTTSQCENIYGLLAGFAHHEQVLEAARRAYAEGYRRMDAFTPFPVPGLAAALGHGANAIPLIVLCGGIIGAVGGYLMQWYAMAVDYPLNIGGRPLQSWPQFIPITFELTVLAAALSAFVGALALNRLPEPYHPVFNAPGFERATRDRFYLCLEAADPKFHRHSAWEFLASLNPEELVEVEP